jgi:prepilin-type N-terminal cleavage/methylation domain-containing protein
MAQNVDVQNHPKFPLIDSSAKRGFTLIELSIVLIIVGLIVGGILVGHDLINMAQIRATVGQIEKFNAAINAFHEKYNGLPGDLHYENTAAFGFFTFADTAGGGNAGARGYGDGNGVIESTDTVGAEELTKGIGETIVFWRHLSEAQLVEGMYGVVGSAAIVATTGAVSGLLNDHFISDLMPQAKVGDGSFFPVYAYNNRHYFEFHALRAVGTNGWYDSRTALLLQPHDAYLLDAKMDDGKPNTGAVVARGEAGSAPGTGHGGLNQPPNNGLAPNPINCVVGPNLPLDPADDYDSSNATSACSLRIPFN